MWCIKNFEKYFMAHQYMPKIFHELHKNPQAPPPTCLMYGPLVEKLKYLNILKLFNSLKWKFPWVKRVDFKKCPSRKSFYSFGKDSKKKKNRCLCLEVVDTNKCYNEILWELHFQNSTHNSFTLRNPFLWMELKVYKTFINSWPRLSQNTFVCEKVSHLEDLKTSSLMA